MDHNVERADRRHISRDRIGNAAAKLAPGSWRDIWATAGAFFCLPQPCPRIARLVGSPSVDSREKHEGKRITGEAPVTMTGLSLFVCGRGYGPSGAEIPAHRAPCLGPHRGRGLLPLQGRQVCPGGAREWDTGTRHVPGIPPADLDELIAHGASAVVLSCGMWQRRRVSPETLQALA